MLRPIKRSPLNKKLSQKNRLSKRNGAFISKSFSSNQNSTVFSNSSQKFSSTYFKQSKSSQKNGFKGFFSQIGDIFSGLFSKNLFSTNKNSQIRDKKLQEIKSKGPVFRQNLQNSDLYKVFAPKVSNSENQIDDEALENSKNASDLDAEQNSQNLNSRIHNHEVSSSLKKLFYKSMEVFKNSDQNNSGGNPGSNLGGNSNNSQNYNSNNQDNKDVKPSFASFFGNFFAKIKIFFGLILKFFIQKAKYANLKFDILKKINLILSATLIIISLCTICYISFFDTYFLVKNYQIEFEKDSYLSENDTKTLLLNFQKNNLLGFLPGNQFWYLNNQHLTNTAKNLFSDVEYVAISKRVWPNTAVLKIKTKPILLTLHINSQEYWRISQSGDVLTKDDLKMKERLVTVRNEIVMNNKNPEAFRNYSFKNDLIQKEKFWFINWMWSEMDALKIRYAKTEIVSLYDSDVLIRTAAGTELRFDSHQFSKNAQKIRLATILSDTTLSDQERDSQIAYIDFRIPGKIFVCKKGNPCEK